MKFQFSQYQYQTDAANAVCDAFEGQPKQAPVSYIRDVGTQKADVLQDAANRGTSLFTGSDLDDDTGYHNADVQLNAEQLLQNIQGIQRHSNLVESQQLGEEKADQNLGAATLKVEMETGTGKTFVYTKTMFELNRRYGWTKFIIVVPSIAIREGVAKSLDTTQDYFYTSGQDGTEGYEKKLNWFIYDSNNLNELDKYAQSQDISVMIINMQAFNTSMKEDAHNKQSRIIFSERDEFGSRKPIDVIAAVRPIIIRDEPQKLSGSATLKGLKRFKPLFMLDYSATHDNPHNIIYSLDSLDAYNQHLVKRIEVKGFELNNMRGTDGYLYLQDIIVSKNRPPQARIEYKKLSSSGSVTTGISTFDENDNLYTASGELEAYRDGWVIAPDGIVPDQDDQLGYVRFMNGETLQKGQVLNDGTEEDLRRIQIRETILSHLNKEEQLRARGIKCLSLFFIDHVNKYRQYDDNGEAVNGEYANIFEEEYDRCVSRFLDGRLDDGHGYHDFLRHTWGKDVHQGYFSIDKKGHSIDSKTSRNSDESDDTSAYDLILKNKEQLLSLNEPTRFIFSHSALREGWDNPNVFQICTLKHSDNEVGKRQEVGRGLRLCVNKDGVRQDATVLGDGLVQQVNLLTVIASESYEKFAQTLQKDMTSKLRERPAVIDNALLTHVCIPAENLGPEHAGEPDITFNEHEASDIIYSLIFCGLLGRDGKPTAKYKDEGFTKESIATLPDELQEKAPAISLVMNSVLEGITSMFIGNALKSQIEQNPLNDNWEKKEFQDLWKRINHKYAYTVDFDDAELIRNAVQAINSTLTVSKLSYTVTKGTQRETGSRIELAAGTHFERSETRTSNLEVDAANGVTYDLLGEISQAALITRKCAAQILKSINRGKFLMFRDNPEQFIARVGKIIIEQKAAMVVDHISYDRIEGEYESDIFTRNSGVHYETDAYRADKCVQDWVFPDGSAHESVERRFAENLDAAEEVAVYAKLPRGFQIPTPVGGYAPDWAVAFREGNGLKHLYFVAETKGSMDTFQLRAIEDSKIKCADQLFNKLHLAEDVHYEKVDTYAHLLDKVKELQ